LILHNTIGHYLYSFICHSNNTIGHHLYSFICHSKPNLITQDLTDCSGLFRTYQVDDMMAAYTFWHIFLWRGVTDILERFSEVKACNWLISGQGAAVEGPGYRRARQWVVMYLKCFPLAVCTDSWGCALRQDGNALLFSRHNQAVLQHHLAALQPFHSTCTTTEATSLHLQVWIQVCQRIANPYWQFKFEELVQGFSFNTCMWNEAFWWPSSTQKPTNKNMLPMICTHTRTHTYTHIHMYIHTYIHTHCDTHTHTHTHTHTYVCTRVDLITWWAWYNPDGLCVLSMYSKQNQSVNQVTCISGTYMICLVHLRIVLIAGTWWAKFW